jgi:hypothetical protein
VRYPDSEGRYAQVFGKITMPGLLIEKLIENYAIMPSTRQIGYKKRDLFGVRLGERRTQNYFDYGDNRE